MKASGTASPLLLLVLLTYSGPLLALSDALADAQPVGPLTMTLRLEPGWSRLEDPSDAQELLDRESVQHELYFALGSDDGALIIGTYGEYAKLALDARGISSTPVPGSMTGTWGLDPDRITNDVVRLPSDLEVARMSATGRGSGRDFITSDDVSTVAVWIYVPTIYRSEDRFKSGMLVLQFRSPEGAADQGGLRFFYDLVDTVRPRNGYPQGSIADFLEQSVAAPAPAPQPPVSPVGVTAAATEVPMRSGSHTPELERDLSPERLKTLADSVFTGSGEPQLSALEQLRRAFPANPYLNLLAERLQIREFLKNDPDGQKRRALESLHTSALEKERQESGRAAAKKYRQYLKAVWPDNPISG